MLLDEEEIMNLIETGSLQSAQSSIHHLEKAYSSSKLLHTKKLLYTKITNLKKLFASKSTSTSQKLTTFPNKQLQPQIKITHTSTPTIINNNSITIENLKDTFIKVTMNATQIFIIKCENISTSKFECKDSVCIRDTSNSRIVCKAGQIRLMKCRDVVIEVYTETGVFIEECEGIVIRKLGWDDGGGRNMWERVYDFSESTGRNYKVLY